MKEMAAESSRRFTKNLLKPGSAAEIRQTASSAVRNSTVTVFYFTRSKDESETDCKLEPLQVAQDHCSAWLHVRGTGQRTRCRMLPTPRGSSWLCIRSSSLEREYSDPEAQVPLEIQCMCVLAASRTQEVCHRFQKICV
ncbi:hypothetical protein AOLI_G00218780 [Acnodon oligacanthus]